MLPTRAAAWLAIAMLARAGWSAEPQTGRPPADSRSPQNVVLWISVDGLRGDYVDRGVTPFLKNLMQHGAYSRQLAPVFPSLTFPSHVSQATGVPPGVHGIVSNNYYDAAAGRESRFPGDPNLLLAEPIWLTAARQGVRAAVFDWPLSQGEERLPPSTARAAYFNLKYDSSLSDTERVGKLLETYRSDAAGQPAEPHAQPPLRLLMGYIHDIDSAGHRHGPDAVETTRAIQETDRLLRHVVQQTAAIFKRQMQPAHGDGLYVLITTDHGMTPVKRLVNLRKLIGGTEAPDSVVAVYSGSVANIYLDKLAPAQRGPVRDAIVRRLKQAPFAKFWTRDALPEKWGPPHTTRTGDIVISLNAGYIFTHRGEATTMPAESDKSSLRGMHGYDPAEVADMLGFMVLCRYGSQRAGVDLGPVDSLLLHSTVADLLEIDPVARAARGRLLRSINRR